MEELWSKFSRAALGSSMFVEFHFCTECKSGCSLDFATLSSFFKRFCWQFAAMFWIVVLLISQFGLSCIYRPITSNLTLEYWCMSKLRTDSMSPRSPNKPKSITLHHCGGHSVWCLWTFANLCHDATFYWVFLPPILPSNAHLLLVVFWNSTGLL